MQSSPQRPCIHGFWAVACMQLSLLIFRSSIQQHKIFCVSNYTGLYFNIKWVQVFQPQLRLKKGLANCLWPDLGHSLSRSDLVVGCQTALKAQICQVACRWTLLRSYGLRCMRRTEWARYSSLAIYLRIAGLFGLSLVSVSRILAVMTCQRMVIRAVLPGSTVLSRTMVGVGAGLMLGCTRSDDNWSAFRENSEHSLQASVLVFLGSVAMGLRYH